MNQLNLFDDQSARGMHRRTDPDTSRVAALEALSTGLIGRQSQAVLEAVRTRQGLTSDELAGMVDLGPQSRHAVARRLPELEKIGLVRKGEKRRSARSGRLAVTWWVVSLASTSGD